MHQCTVVSKFFPLKKNKHPSMSFPFLRRSASATCCARIAFGSRVAVRKMFLGQTRGTFDIPMDPNGSQWIPFWDVEKPHSPDSPWYGQRERPPLRYNLWLQGLGITRRVGSRLKTRKRRQTIVVNLTTCFFYEIMNLCKQYQPLPECHDFV